MKRYGIDLRTGREIGMEYGAWCKQDEAHAAIRELSDSLAHVTAERNHLRDVAASMSAEKVELLAQIYALKLELHRFQDTN